MNSIPPELAELEERLRGRAAPAASPELRERVLGAVAGTAAADEKWECWHWAALAAAVLVVLNLSMISGSRSEFLVWRTPSPQQIGQEIQLVQRLEAEQEGTLK